MDDEAVIYVRLLDEGVPVMRPTKGTKIEEHVYRLLPTEDYSPTLEKWEFLPGQAVFVERQVKDDQVILIAQSVSD